MSHTVWLLPKEKSTKDYLSSVISGLASEYEGPIFEPHTTLLGDIGLTLTKMQANCQKLVKHQTPFIVETGLIEYSTTYYQCLFVRLKPSPELMTLYTSAKQIFGLSHPSVFMPHISLFYGNISFSARHQIMKAVKFIPQRFTVSSLVVTPGGEHPPSEWKHLLELPFV